MRAVLQRVSEARVVVDGATVGEIGAGLVALVSFAPEDGPEDLAWMARKLVGLRVFEDEAEKMNLALGDVGGGLLIVPNFTLHGDCRRGRRPSFTGAAAPELAERLFGDFLRAVEGIGVRPAKGVFGAHMALSLVNDGPVTLVVDSRRDGG